MDSDDQDRAGVSPQPMCPGRPPRAGARCADLRPHARGMLARTAN